MNAGHVAKGEASDSRRIGNPRVDRVDAWTTNHDQSTCIKRKNYNGSDETSGSSSRSPDRDPRGAMQSVLKRISNGSSGPSISDPTDAIYSKRSMMDRSIVIVDHFDRTVTPKCTIKQDVLRCSKAFKLEIKKLICLDTSPLVSLDLIVFYSQFRTSGAFEIKIW